MTFGQPLWFWAYGLLPLFALLFFRNEGKRRRLLTALVATRLQDRLAGSVSLGKRRLRFALLLLGMGAIILSLAQPRRGYTWEKSQRKGLDLIIAIDVSKSMLSTDVSPSRLGRAKLAAQDFIAQLKGDRVGLIAFAGSAFLQAPLTADFAAVLTSLNEFDTDIIPRGGTNIAEAIRMAAEAFGKGESDHRALLIFTDGEELDADGIKAAEDQRGSMRIFGIGVGTPEGSLIPVAGSRGGTEFVRDENGQFVKSRLDEERLRKIAESTGGFYLHLQSGPAEMTQIIQQGLGTMTEKDIDARLSRQPIERYQWPLAAGLLLLAGSLLINERKRGLGLRERAPIAAAAGWLAMALLASSARAAEAPRELYERGEYSAAEKAYEEQVAKDPKSGPLAFNWGAAAYKSKDLETALKAFSQALTSPNPELREKAEYNLANTLFQKGASGKMDQKTLEDALAHYGQALKMAPADANAKYNEKVTRDLLEKLKQKEQEQQQQQPKDKDKDKDQQKKDQKDQDKKDQQSKGQNQDKKDQGGKDQQKQDQQKKDGQGEGQQKEQSQGKAGDDKGEQKDQSQGGKPAKEDKQNGAGGGESQRDPAEGAEKQAKNAGKKDQAKGQQKEPSSPEGQGKDAENGQPLSEPGNEENKQKPSGELKANPSPGQEAKEAAAEAAADAEAAAEGKMTERQAKMLLDSLRSEDERVRLLDPSEKKRAGRILHDW